MAGHHGNRRSLAKGPIGLIGLVMLAYGVTGLIFGSNSFTEQAFDGTVNGDDWLGLEANGWTNLLIAAGGALLVFSAPLHRAAKTMAIVVGLGLGAVSLIALGDGEDALGIFAADDVMRIALAAASVALLLAALLPRVGRDRSHDVDGSDDRDTRAADRRLDPRDGEAVTAGERGHVRTERGAMPAERERVPAERERVPAERERDTVLADSDRENGRSRRD